MMNAIGAGGGLAAGGMSRTGPAAKAAKAGPRVPRTPRVVSRERRPGEEARRRLRARRRGLPRAGLLPARRVQPRQAVPEDLAAPGPDEAAGAAGRRAQALAAGGGVRLQQQSDLAKTMMMANSGLDEETKDTIKKMWKKFLEWLKEMDAIFLKPAPQ